MPGEITSSGVMPAVQKNGNVKTSTVAAVMAAVLLAVSAVLFLWRMDAAQGMVAHGLDTRVTRLEERYEAIDKKLNILLERGS